MQLDILSDCYDNSRGVIFYFTLIIFYIQSLISKNSPKFATQFLPACYQGEERKLKQSYEGISGTQ